MQDRSLCHTPLRRILWVPVLKDGWELRDQTWQAHSSHTKECACEV